MHFMAENVAWIHDHAAGSHPRMIVWAHDAHIANNASYYTGYAPKGTENLGGFLRTWYKQSYLPIATSLYQEPSTRIKVSVSRPIQPARQARTHITTRWGMWTYPSICSIYIRRRRDR